MEEVGAGEAGGESSIIRDPLRSEMSEVNTETKLDLTDAPTSLPSLAHTKLLSRSHGASM